MKIPKKNRDLANYVCRRDIIRLVCFALWVALLIGGALFYNYEHPSYPEYRRMVGWRMAVWATGSVVSGFLLFRVWKIFLDRSFSGTIIDAGLSRSWSASDDPGAATDYDFRLKTSLKVRTDKGRLRRIRFEQKPGFYLYYHEGERVAKLRGLPYPVNLDPTAKSGCVCSACGAWRREKAPHCEACGMSLIDPEELI